MNQDGPKQIGSDRSHVAFFKGPLLTQNDCFSLTALHSFPYVKKRIPVMYQHHTDLNPIEVAIDEMSKKVAELRQVCSSSEVDMIKLQLKLQGSVSVQVSFPVMAYYYILFKLYPWHYRLVRLFLDLLLNFSPIKMS